MEKSYFKSPIGILEIISEKDALVSLKLVEKMEVFKKKNDFIDNVENQLTEYFSGKRENFDINLNPQGTFFQKQVWTKLLEIPYGEVKSYSEIAKQIANQNAARAVGNACNKNPIMIVIPCHRVVSKTGNLGGFAYGNLVKQRLLELENFVL